MRVPLAIRFVVVSCPPIMVTMALAITSSSVNRSPSTSAFINEATSPSGRKSSLRMADLK